MGLALDGTAFAAGAVISLGASWILASRLEKLCGRLGVPEAMLGLVAALAADSPEVVSAITAMARHERAVGAGIVVGSNVFNLAALLGLSSLVAGGIWLHRRVVVLAGSVALTVAVVTFFFLAGWLGPSLALALSLAVIAPEAALASMPPARRESLRLPAKLRRWLVEAISEEETELHGAYGHRAALLFKYQGQVRARALLRGNLRDGSVLLGALVVVVGASAAMEQSAARAGSTLGLAGIVTGGIILAAVTSLPNAVTAIYLARRKRGPAVLSTALNSNALNVVAGLFVPALVVGYKVRSTSSIMIGAWYLGLTVLAISFAWRFEGLARRTGSVIIIGYLAFAATLPIASNPRNPVAALLVPAVIVATAGAAVLAVGGRAKQGRGS